MQRLFWVYRLIWRTSTLIDLSTWKILNNNQKMNQMNEQTKKPAKHAKPMECLWSSSSSIVTFQTNNIHWFYKNYEPHKARSRICSESGAARHCIVRAEIGKIHKSTKHKNHKKIETNQRRQRLPWHLRSSQYRTRVLVPNDNRFVILKKNLFRRISNIHEREHNAIPTTTTRRIWSIK